MIIHCFFEQSGTFKNEFKKLGYQAFDYDIQNEFKETDFIIDLFEEINNSYNGKHSVFDNISKEDLIIAFFPCIRFEEQIQLHFRGTAYQLKNKTDIEKLEYDLKLQNELTKLYDLVTKLAIICLKLDLKLIIENPYSKNHYLTKYWCLPAKIIDIDRSKKGDYYVKPTQYWFINREPSQNMIFEPQIWLSKKRIAKISNKIERSLISSSYANRFIREFIL